MHGFRYVRIYQDEQARKIDVAMQASIISVQAAEKRSALHPEPHKVWLIDEGHAGHRAQAVGILHALDRLGVHLDVTTISCESSLRGVLRPVAKAIFDRLGGEGALRFARHVAEFSVPDDGPPRFIISSGGRTAFVSRALSLSTGAPNVFVGNLGQFPPDWFTVVMSPVDLRRANSIVTKIVPNTMTPDACRDQSQRYWNSQIPEHCWALLIGGANRRSPYADQDWRDIAAGVNALAERFGIKWLITTSRRTGTHVEQLLEEAISSDVVAEFVLFSRNAKKVVMPFLGAAEIVFVTQDSLTMLGEAVASGRPVVALSPKVTKSVSDSYGGKVLNNYYRLPQFSGAQCSNMYEYTPDENIEDMYVNSENFIADSVASLASYLQIT